VYIGKSITWHDRAKHLSEDNWKWKRAGQLIQLLEKVKDWAFCRHVDKEGADEL